MDNGIRIPIRVKSASSSRRTSPANRPEDSDRALEVTERGPVAEATLPMAQAHPEPGAPGAKRGTQKPIADTREESAEGEDLDMWRDRALRLQAEMENFRKRQQRLADERVAADRERLLRAFLRVADDLERALHADGTDAESLRQGVGLTHQSLMHIIDQEGAEPIEAGGRPFDPAWHEAVGTVPSRHAGAAPDTVVKVVQPGYRIGDRLLRPARVIVAT